MTLKTAKTQPKSDSVNSYHSEWRWAVTFALIFVAVTWVPYLTAYAITPSGMHYLWLLGNPDDQNVHLMWARQAADGAWRFKDLYTTESHPGMFVHSLMWAIGQLHRITGVPLHLLYQFMRSVAAFGLCLAAYALARSCLITIPARRLFMLILCFSSGFGWFTWLCRSMFNIQFPLLIDVSPELMMPEAITFLAALVAPLAIAGMALATAIMTCMMQFTRTHNFRFVAYAAILTALLGNVHTYVAVALVTVFAAWWVFQVIWHTWMQYIQLSRISFSKQPLMLACGFSIVAVAGGLGALPQWLAFRADPAFRIKALTPTLTPPAWILCASYGFIALLALVGIAIAVRTRWHALPMALGWVVGIAIAIYMPVSFQRKMIEGLHVPLCLLAAYACNALVACGFERCARTNSSLRWFVKSQRIAWFTFSAILIAVAIPSNIAYIGLNMHWVIHNNLLVERRLQPPYYLSDTELKLLQWLRTNANRNDAILCSSMLGNYVPVLTGNPVFIGHWAETLDFNAKLNIVVSCYRWDGSEQQVAMWRKLIEEHHVRYVLVTKFERGLAGGIVTLPPFCQMVFSANGDAIYLVR